MNITKAIVNSQNWQAGREGNAVTGIVLHTEVGTQAGAQARFNDPASQVSVHYGVGLDGNIRQWVEEANTAYQAGNWQVNLRTIGIEHEDNGNANDAVRTAALYEASSDLVADICRRYKLPCDTNHIFLHKNVIDKSAYPGGTACPDGLDTNKIISMATAKLQGEEMLIEKGDVDAIFKVFLGVTPAQSDYDWGVGKTWDVYVKAVMARPEATVQDADVRALFAKFITTPVVQADLDFARGLNWRKYIGLVMARPDCVSVGSIAVNKQAVINYINTNLK